MLSSFPKTLIVKASRSMYLIFEKIALFPAYNTWCKSKPFTKMLCIWDFLALLGSVFIKENAFWLVAICSLIEISYLI